MKNRKIKIDGVPHSIKYVEEIETGNPDKFAFGRSNSIYDTIYIATKYPNGKDMPKQQMELTYYHELLHAMFNQGQYEDNENLIEYLAKRLYELKRQNAL